MKNKSNLVMIFVGILLVAIGILSDKRSSRQVTSTEKTTLIRSIQDSLHKLEVLESYIYDHSKIPD